MINFGFPGFIFQAKVTRFSANVGLNMLINISPGFYHIRKKKQLVANVFHIFQQQKAMIRLYALKGPFQDIWHKTFDINSSVSQNTV